MEQSIKNNIVLQNHQVKDKVLIHLERYSAISALSGKEGLLWEVIKGDFNPRNSDESISEYRVDGKIKYGILRSNIRITTPPTNKAPLWIVHLDRVPSTLGEPHTNTIIDHGDYVEGQLDNIISIAILKVLFDEGILLNIIFTTEEEIVKSDVQILEFLSSFNTNQLNPHNYIITNYDTYYPITIDIDVFAALRDFKYIGISIRDYDNTSTFDEDIVDHLREIADGIEVNHFTNTGYAIVETGFLCRLTGGLYQGAHIGIPISNYHTANECTYWSTIYEAYKLVREVSNTYET